MKKVMISVIAFLVAFLMIGTPVHAQGASVIIRTATATTNAVSVEGTTSAVAVAIQIRNEDGTQLIAMRTEGTVDGVFSANVDGLNLTTGTTYSVYVADYEGGNWTTLSVVSGGGTSSGITVSSIAVTTPPTKTTYTYGESLDKTGLEVTATYSDHSTAVVPLSDLTFEGAVVPGNNTITVKYDGKSATFTITVSKAQIDLKNLAWTAGTYTYTGNVQGPTFTETLPAGVRVSSHENSVKKAAGDYTAVANIALVDGYSSANYELVNSTGAEGIVISADKATATVSKAWSIGKATPTLTLSNLSETTQSPTGVKAILSPADASASVKIEYEVVTTPAREEQACKYADGHLEDCSSQAGDPEECDCGYTESHEHDSSCGYVAAQEEVKGWTTVRPTMAGTYPVRATLPEASDCLLAVTTPVTGTYTLTAYQAPTPTPEPEQPKEPEKTQEEIAIEKAVEEQKAAVEADLKEEIVPIDMTKEEVLEELPSAVVAAIEATINAIVAAIPVENRNNTAEKAPVVQTMDVSAMRTETGFTNAMVKSAEHFEKTNCDVGAVYTGNWVFINSKTAKAWEEVTVDIVWIFEHKGRTYKVTIPKGTDLTSILDKNGFAGPLYIGKVLGTCEVIK